MDQQEEIQYTPESQLRHPGVLFGTMWRDLAASRELAWRLTVRDITSRYRRSLLGITWAIFPPIVGALVFILLRRGGVLETGETKVPYPVHVMTGMVLWTVFTRGIDAPLKVIGGSTSLFSKVNFPREALVLSAIQQVLFDMGIKLVILAGVFAAFKVTPTWGVLGAVPAMLMLMLMGITIGLLLVPFALLYTDVVVGLPVVTGLWFLLTPVAFRWPGRLGELLDVVNPLSPVLIGARDLATRGTMENPGAFFVVCSITLGMLLLAWVLYRLALPVLVERMQA